MSEGRKLVPRLRFPEFRGAGDWMLTGLGSIASFSSGGTPSKDNPEYWNGSIPWVSASSMYEMHVSQADHYVTPLAIGNGTRIAKKGTLLILVRGSMLFKRVPMCIAAVDVAFNQDVKSLKIDQSVDSHFLIYQLLANESRIPINETGIGAGKIELADLKEFGTFIPNQPEQRRITDCLTTLDDLIAAQARKVNALKTHKKGLMQQLFPREGETQPRLRFPEFRAAGEWSIQPFGNFVTRSFYGTSSSTSKTGRYPVLRMGNMLDGRLLFSNLAHLDLAPEAFESIRLLPGDILLNRTNSPALVGKISMFDRDVECITASYIVTYRVDKARINPIFCNLMLNTPHYQMKINAMARPSVSQANINPTTFRKELVVSVPSLAEQQRIADCLTFLDDFITAQVQKLEAHKTHKKGLLQQLFPSAEQVTA